VRDVPPCPKAGEKNALGNIANELKRKFYLGQREVHVVVDIAIQLLHPIVVNSDVEPLF